MRNRTDLQRKDFDQLKQTTQNYLYSFNYNSAINSSRFTLTTYFKEIFGYVPPASMNRKMIANSLANYIYDQRNIIKTEANIDNTQLNIQIPDGVVTLSQSTIDKSQALVEKQQDQLKKIAELVAKITSLEETINTLSLDNSSLKSDLSNENKKKEELSKNITKLSKELELLNVKYNTLISDSKNKENELNNVIQNITTKNQELTELLNTCNKELEEKILSLKLLKDNSTIEISELNKKINLFKNEIINLKKEIKTITTNFLNSSKKNDTIIQQLQKKYDILFSSTETEINNLKTKLTNSEKNLNLSSKKTTDLENEISKLKLSHEKIYNENIDKLNELKKEKQEIRDEYTNLQTKNESIKKEYELKLKNLTNEMLQLKQSHNVVIKDLNEKLDNKTKELNKNIELVKSLEKQIADNKTKYDKKTSDKDNKITKLENKIDELNELLTKNEEQYKLELETKNKKIKQNIEIINDFTKNLSNTKENNNKIKKEYINEINELKSTITDLKNKLNENNKLIDSFQNQLKQLESIIENKNKTIKSYEDAVSSYKKQLDECNKSIANIKRTNEDLIKTHKEQLKSIEKEKSSLKKELDTKTALLFKIQTDLDNENKKVLELLENINQLKAIINSRNKQLTIQKEKENQSKISKQTCTDEIKELRKLKKSFESQQKLLLQKIKYIIDNTDSIKNERIKKTVKENFNKYNELLTLNAVWNSLSDLLQINIADIKGEKCTEVIDISERLLHFIGKMKENRSQIYSDYEDVKGVARIFLRVRGGQGVQNDLVDVIDNHSISFKNPCSKQIKEFQGYSNVFSKKDTNIAVFNKVRPLIDTVKTNNIFIMGYGRSGSGKTYTLLGNEDNKGIIQLTVNHLLNNKRKLNIKNIKLSSLELYINSMFDLLKLKPSISSRGLSDDQTRWLSNKNNVWPPKELKYKRSFLSINNQVNKTSVEISSLTNIDMINTIMYNRMTAETENNPVSSRSHLLLIFTVQFENGTKQNIVFADLAGNEEWWNFNQNSSNTLKQEGKSITRSLYSLKNGIIAYHSGRQLPSSTEKLYNVIDNFIDFNKSKGGSNAKIGIIFNTKDFLSIKNPSEIKYECDSFLDTLNFSQALINA